MKNTIVLLVALALAGCSWSHAAPRTKSKPKSKGGEIQLTEFKTQIPNRDPREEEEEEEDDVDPPPPGPGPQPQPQPNPVPVQPELELPATVEGDAGTFIPIKGKTNGKEVKWVSMDKGLAVFPAGMLRDATATVVQSAVGGQYRLLAYTARGDVPSDPVVVMVVVHGPQPPPNPVPPNPVPPGPGPQPNPVTPAPTPPDGVLKSSNLWIIPIDDISKRSAYPQVAALLTDTKFWYAQKAAGHQFEIVNITDTRNMARFKTQIDLNGGLPCVVIMDANVTTWTDKNGVKQTGNRWLNQDPKDLALPANTASMQALINKFSK
jgi:hypothetical protein